MIERASLLLASGDEAAERDDLAGAQRDYLAALEALGSTADGMAERAVLCNRLGSVSLARGDSAAAVDLHLQALSFSTSLSRPTREHAQTFLHLGAAHRFSGDAEAAEQAYLQAIALSDDDEDTALFRAAAHANIGSIRADAGALDDAEQAYRASLAVFEEHGSTYDDLALAHLHIGDLHRLRGDVQGAEHEYDIAAGLHELQGRAPLELALAHAFALLRQEEADGTDDPTEERHLLREALAFAAYAAEAAERRRFQFATEHERAAWTTHRVIPVLRIAFALAVRVGDAYWISDLIAHSRSSGILTTDLSDTHVSPFSLAEPSVFAEPGRDDAAPAMTAGRAATADIGLDAIFRRTPLPALQMPDGRIALAQEEPSGRFVRYI